MTELYAILLAWAVELSGYPAPAAPPAIEMAPHAYLIAHACGGRECKVLGWFPPGHTIYLDSRLRPDQSLQAASIVVHEMVHYLQSTSGRYARPYPCEQIVALEREAYAVQTRYIVHMGVYQPIEASMYGAGCEVIAAHE